ELPARNWRFGTNTSAHPTQWVLRIRLSCPPIAPLADVVDTRRALLQAPCDLCASRETSKPNNWPMLPLANRPDSLPEQQGSPTIDALLRGHVTTRRRIGAEIPCAV